ncbi:MAG: HAMP domain-containing sensor histidine kinase [Flavobacteriaceae bacterium]|nr:HAMP domain-containing sensor histidine kinase [Flavobacteriaceae bacterium]
MTLILLVSGLMVFLSNIYQYDAQSEKYHFDRLNRKESQIHRHINYLVDKYDLVGADITKWKDLESDFTEIKQIHSVDYSLFSLDGQSIFTYFVPLEVLANNNSLDQELIRRLQENPENRILEANVEEREDYSSSYRILKDRLNTPYAILFYPYFSDIDIAENELNVFLQRIYKIYLFLFVGAIIVAYFLSRYVTRSIESVRSKLSQTDLQVQNEKIEIVNAPIEIVGLIEAYNKMIDQLELSADQLVREEKDFAWREMARQVSHEVKNALTPMRLAVQDFSYRFKPTTKGWQNRLQEFSSTLTEQIESMAEVAESFSDYTAEPKMNPTQCDMVKHTKLVVASYSNIKTLVKSSHEKIIYTLDVNQWTRVLNNLVQNAQQAIPSDREGYVEINFQLLEDKIVVDIKDNGVGIDPKLGDTVFEPKFTTKSSGRGRGLGIVRNIIRSHQGTITYKSELKVGVTFKITFPLN